MVVSQHSVGRKLHDLYAVWVERRRKAVNKEVLNSTVQTGYVHYRMRLNTSSWSSLGMIADACGLREKQSGSLSHKRASAEEICSPGK